MSKYTTTRIQISGHRDTMEQICHVITECNTAFYNPGEEYGPENSALTILSKLHVNTKNINELSTSTWWFKPYIDDKGRLIFTDFSWGDCSRFEELIKSRFGNSITNIAYTWLDYS